MQSLQNEIRECVSERQASSSRLLVTGVACTDKHCNCPLLRFYSSHR